MLTNLIVALLVGVPLLGLMVYLIALVVRALTKYIKSKDVRAEKSDIKKSLGETL